MLLKQAGKFCISTLEKLKKRHFAAFFLFKPIFLTKLLLTYKLFILKPFVLNDFSIQNLSNLFYPDNYVSFSKLIKTSLLRDNNI